MYTPYIAAPTPQKLANLKYDFLLAAQRVRESDSEEQLEDALRSVEYFLGLLRSNVYDNHNWPVGCDLICIAQDSCMGLRFCGKYKLCENLLDSTLIIVDYNGEKRYQYRSNFKLA